jgi:hypothetical protein
VTHGLGGGGVGRVGKWVSWGVNGCVGGWMNE